MPRPDPFRPPAREERTIDLATLPPRPQPLPQAPAEAAPLAPQPAETRRPLEYRKPRASWVTVMILGFACVGVAAIGAALIKKMSGVSILSKREAALQAQQQQQQQQPTVYRALAQDDGVLVTVQVTPREAQLLLDGEPLVSNPVRLPRGTRAYKIAATADGFAPRIHEFTPDAPKTIKLKLARAGR